jgi:hypothetical protein
MKRRSLLNQMRNLRRSLIADPDFSRMEYIKYADDCFAMIFVSGSLKDAKFIQSNIKAVGLSKLRVKVPTIKLIL